MDALLIIDVQNDFCPGGALPVPDGDRVVVPLNRLAERFELVIATRDWHPPDHRSFTGAWPVHCVQGTDGAQLHPQLRIDLVDLVVDKGTDRATDGYSAFEHTGLAALLRDHGVERIVVGGLATDYCVKQSVLDGLLEGFAVTVVEDAVRGVDVRPGDAEQALAAMAEAGAKLAQSTEILAELL